MQRFKVALSIIVLALSPLAGDYTARAATGGVVISQLQTGGSGSGTASQEFVELFNNTANDVDVTGWCTTYASAGDTSQSTIACFDAPDSFTKVWLKAKSYALFVSPALKEATGQTGDSLFTYAGGISGTAGHVRLVDTAKTDVDRVGWGATATHPEGTTALVPTGGKSLQRIAASDGLLKDSDNNSADFTVQNPLFHVSGLYETVTDVCPNIDGTQMTIPVGMVDDHGNCVTSPPLDVCPNLAGVQADIPVGYLADGNGDCQVDSCLNLAGLQVSIPENYDSDTMGNCTLHDECANLDGAQVTMPDGFVRSTGNDCKLDLLPLKITELLPNVNGVDTGNEFIEIYNPTDRDADLSRYTLFVGVASEKFYAFPIGAHIKPGEYAVFHDSDMKFTLVNTTGRVTLRGADDTPISQTDAYDKPGNGMAWADIDGVWQYTDQPTPGSLNLPSLPDQPSDPADLAQGLAACPTGKYRNPLTNRCRTIESDVAVLASCDADQYRNPETGRCRKIITTNAAVPCKLGQYRSEETGRCRNMTTASTLTPCKAGQERSPDTNRCRNVTSVTSVPPAAFAVQPVPDSPLSFAGWWALGGIGSLALGYGAWEWRREVVRLVGRIAGVFGRH